MKKFWFVFHFLFLTPLFGYCQNIKNISSLDKQIQEDSKNLIIIGEAHTSASSPIIVGEFLKHLDENGQNPQLLLELGASAAYLLDKYIKTGNEELLKGIFFGGVFNEWKSFWQKKYVTNKSVDNKGQLKIIGIDFERVGTFSKAFKELDANYEKLPMPIDSLVEFMHSEKFSKNYTNGFPTQADQKFMKEVKALLKKYLSELEIILNEDDLSFIKATVNNQVIKFAGDRENQIYENIKRVVSQSGNRNSILLIGNEHVNYSYKTLAFLLKSKTELNIINILTLYHNSKIWIKNSYKKQKNIDDLLKQPWKGYRNELKDKSQESFTLIPLSPIGDLKRQADFVIIAKGQEALTW